MADWYLLTKALPSGEPGPAVLLNLDFVQAVEIVTSNGLRIRFGENETITVEGQPALDLVKYLMAKTVKT